jgi:heme exporter protein B
VSGDQMSLVATLMVTARRDLLLAMRRKSDVMVNVFFFVIVVSLFPLGVGPEPALLTKIGPGVLVVAALLSTLLGLPRLFAADHADGTLEQLALSPLPFGLLVSGKILAHWLVCGLPLVLLAPVLGLQFGLDGETLGVLMLALLIATPLLSLIGAIGAALTLGVRGGGALLALLILPLYVPALIFASGAVEAQMAGMSTGGYLSLLAAMLALAVFFAPWATTAALKIALE